VSPFGKSVSGPLLRGGARLGNELDKLLSMVGIEPFALDARAVQARVMKKTGLSDVGDSDVLASMESVFKFLEEDADINLVGRVTVSLALAKFFEYRLRLQHTVTNHPEIEQEQIEAPIFIVGLPRTGTSILHELLAQDPANRVPYSWETTFPFKPDDGSAYPKSANIKKTRIMFDLLHLLAPDFASVHSIGAELPQECLAITAFDYVSFQLFSMFYLPRYVDWMMGQDWGKVYRNHRQFLQFLQWQNGGGNWVLKSPGHLWSVGGIVREYPDAGIILTHRDPSSVISSTSDLLYITQNVFSDSITREKMADYTAQALQRGVDDAIRERESGALDNTRIFDLYFDEFDADKIGKIEEIYGFFGRSLSAEAADAMRIYLAAHPANRLGGHQYSKLGHENYSSTLLESFRRYHNPSTTSRDVGVA